MKVYVSHTAIETPPKVTTLCLFQMVYISHEYIYYLLFVCTMTFIYSENSYSRWLAVCFCHHYFNAKIVVLLATELSLKLASLAGWQAFSMSLVPFDSASLILDDSNTEMFLQAAIFSALCFCR